MNQTIKDFRKAKGITQQALAEYMGVDRTTVTKWETGESIPQTRDIPRLAEFLGCEIGDLFAEAG